MEQGKDLERLVDRIDSLSHRIVRIGEQQNEKVFCKVKDLSVIEISVLSILCDNPQMIMRDISKKLHVSKSSMTGIVDKLEQSGLVRRTINRSDRRSYALEVTKEGKLAQKEHLKRERSAFLQFVSAMQACDVPETYLDQTEKILDYLEKSEANTKQTS